MNVKSRNKSLTIWFLLATMLIAGCATTQFRGVQNDFNLAVQADNEKTVQFAVVSPLFYQQVIDSLFTITYDKKEPEKFELNPTQLFSRLNEKLKPTAYVLATVSLWRIGKLKEAKGMAERGLSDIEKFGKDQYPRDYVFLKSMGGLLIDAQQIGHYKDCKKSNGDLPSACYTDNDMIGAYQLAAKELKDAYDPKYIPANTPQDIIYYVHYQRWRVVQNYFFITSKIIGVDTKKISMVKAGQSLQSTLSDSDKCHDFDTCEAVFINEIQKEQNSVPKKHPLHKFMDSMTAKDNIVDAKW